MSTSKELRKLFHRNRQKEIKFTIGNSKTIYRYEVSLIGGTLDAWVYDGQNHDLMAICSPEHRGIRWEKTIFGEYIKRIIPWDEITVIPESIEENTPKYTNFYHCPECDNQWEDQWSCMCNDKCANCGTECEPFKSEPLESESVNA